MKRIFPIFAAIALLLTACTAEPATDETDPVETTAAQGRDDREILSDYLNVTPAGEHDVRLLFINAGKADCTLVMVDDYAALIDTGTAISPAIILPAMEEMGVDSLDAVFFSHTDNDHIGGYGTIAESYPAAACYTSSITTEWSTFESVIGDCAEHIALDPGAVVELTDGVWFEVMGPIRYNPDENEDSLVLRLRVNGVTALFTGDMKYNEETSLIYNDMPLDCDILKVAYHGRADATSEKFIKAASPSVAVITTDRAEDSDSAHQSIVDALEDSGADVYVTDETPLGVLVTVGKSGEVDVTSLDTAEDAKNVRITAVSKEDQTVVIENSESEAVDLSGWHIISERGMELFRFPEGAVVEAGDSVTVACTNYSGEHDYVWSDTRVWHKSKDDRAVLIDRWGNKVSSAESK